MTITCALIQMVVVIAERTDKAPIITKALRGVGGLVLDTNGKRFANELGRPDYVTGEMWKSKPPFRLCLNKAASDEIVWHCKHYTGRGVMICRSVTKIDCWVSAAAEVLKVTNFLPEHPGGEFAILTFAGKDDGGARRCRVHARSGMVKTMLPGPASDDEVSASLDTKPCPGGGR